MSDQALTPEHLSALEGLLGHSIEDQPDQRFRAIHELLDRHGTGRILFRNTREAIQGFPGRDCQPAPLPAPEDWSKMANCVNRCGLKKRKLMVHGCKMIRVCHG